MKLLPILLVASFCGVSAVTQAAVYPAKGQSAATQQKDEGECYAWAKKQTGIDPEVLAGQAAPSTARPKSNAARGAAGGAAIGAIAGNAGAGAAAGAMAGGVRRRRQEAEIESQQQAAQAGRSAQLKAFNDAKMACLQGRGYTVQ